jgi:hypothetical protein
MMKLLDLRYIRVTTHDTPLYIEERTSEEIKRLIRRCDSRAPANSLKLLKCVKGMLDRRLNKRRASGMQDEPTQVQNESPPLCESADVNHDEALDVMQLTVPREEIPVPRAREKRNCPLPRISNEEMAILDKVYEVLEANCDYFDEEGTSAEPPPPRMPAPPLSAEPAAMHAFDLTPDLHKANDLSHTVASPVLASHTVASHTVASPVLASHTVASHTVASHTVASHTVASHTVASPVLASPAIPAREVGLHQQLHLACKTLLDVNTGLLECIRVQREKLASLGVAHEEPGIQGEVQNEHDLAFGGMPHFILQDYGFGSCTSLATSPATSPVLLPAPSPVTLPAFAGMPHPNLEYYGCESRTSLATSPATSPVLLPAPSPVLSLAPSPAPSPASSPAPSPAPSLAMLQAVAALTALSTTPSWYAPVVSPAPCATASTPYKKPRKSPKTSHHCTLHPKQAATPSIAGKRKGRPPTAGAAPPPATAHGAATPAPKRRGHPPMTPAKRRSRPTDADTPTATTKKRRVQAPSDASTPTAAPTPGQPPATPRPSNRPASLRRVRPTPRATRAFELDDGTTIEADTESGHLALGKTLTLPAALWRRANAPRAPPEWEVVAWAHSLKRYVVCSLDGGSLDTVSMGIVHRQLHKQRATRNE